MVGHNWIGILQPQDASKPSQPGGCVLCHPGLGLKPNPIAKLTKADLDNVDCLICHAPDYKRTVVKEEDRLRIVPAAGVDVVKVAQKVGKPTNEMCLRCHAGAGGGPNHKHGVTPTKVSDVHIAKGLQCVDCHETKMHKVPGGADIKAQELTESRVACENCHGTVPHKGKYSRQLNGHLQRIACQTCHIPLIARDPAMPTITMRDWTKPVLNEKTGLYGPSNTFATNVKPEYRWWNRLMDIPPEPVGSIRDKKSRIYPWKRTSYTVVADAGSGKPVYIKSGVYAVTGDPGKAAKKGAEDAGQGYGGQWKGVSESMVFSLNHQVAPKGEALQCNACHDRNGVMDFAGLGYGRKKVEKLSRPVK